MPDGTAPEEVRRGDPPADTIFAPATPPGRSGIAVIRLSGPRAREAVEALAGGPLPVHGRALRILRDETGEPLDEALILTFAEGRSFTGEETAEIQGHGSPAAVAAILGALGRQRGLRLAAPGEFAQRALAHGRLDLARIEGLSALLEAETEAQRRQAMRVFQGALGKRAEDWRERLLQAAALTEAMIDFAEEDIPEALPEIARLCGEIAGELEAEARGARLAERLREGFEVAIVGPPNAGKSTLLNRLAGREAALVSDVAGTTRDVIELRMVLDGMPVTLLDTAGLRETADSVERMGGERARARAAAADLRVHLVLPDGPRPAEGPDDIVLRAQADRLAGEGPGISGLTGEGVEALVAEIARRLSARTAALGAGLTARHAHAMAEGAAALREAEALARAGAAPELAGEALRRALAALDALVGRVGTEDILGAIFQRFCIGK
ncbi:tRNA modification GTPase trmE [Rubellimicrobium thermophilum DSM 16684]|uniref:tRNA modification GTPase MnmE n=1 Tax=Rubellimicrobium thermophilum DSM 16684 TaxID=1123069 RepID=S9QSS8_9RHOB|nr:tRNA uridine-5-carboxymethylaminomethyl(34) synthesis GTPase MnmE [Rubellimicrobium thermophilum]EPX84436.1 tRNA modification GTPase trmE [Rubellimicrobium thermophilum DSM 16684]